MAESIRRDFDLKSKSVSEQLRKLRKFSPSSKFEDLENESVQGFVIPDWSAIACSYPKAMEKVFLKLDELKGIDFVSCHEFKKGIETLRQTEQAKLQFQKIQVEQGYGNFIVVPIDFMCGSLGMSPEDVVGSIVDDHNFCLSSFHLAIIILIHFDRIIGGGGLWINCPGDEAADSKGEFVNAPFISVQRKKIWFCSHNKSSKIEYFGSAKTNVK